jgi:hypothetical protein
MTNKAAQTVGELVADFWRRRGVTPEPQMEDANGFKLHEFLDLLGRNHLRDVRL